MELSNIDNEIATDKKPKSEEVSAVNTLNAQNPETSVTQSEALSSDVSRSLASEPTDSDYMRALSEMESDGIPEQASNEMPSDQDYASALADQTSDLQDSPRQTFDDVSSLSQDFDEVRAKEVLEISKKLKIPQDEVIGLLQKHTYDELKNYKGLGDVTTAYPGLYNWAQEPKNYKVLIKNPEKIKRISDNNEFINTIGDETSRLAKANWAQLYQVSLLTAMSTGKVDVNDGIRKLRELDLEIQNNQTKVYDESVKQLGESFTRLERKFKESGDIFATLKDDNLTTEEGRLAAIAKVYKGVTGGIEGMGDVLADVAKDPAAFAVGIAGQSLYSMAPSIAAGAAVTKASTLLVGPFAGVAAGLTAGVTTQAFISYGQSFQQSADKFRDKKTGLVNYEKMFKDPKVLEDLKVKASKYAAAHAIFEFIAGKFIKVDISKAKATIAANKALGLGKAATAKTVAKTGAKSLAASSASEFAGETVAQVATGEPVSKALSEGFVEGLSGSLFGVGQVGLEFATAPAIDAKEASTLDIAKGAAEEVRAKVTSLKNRVKTYREAREVRAKAEAAKIQADSIKDVREQMKSATSVEDRAQAQEMANAMNIFETEDGLMQTGATTINIEDLEKYSAKSGFPVATIVESLGDAAQKSYNDSVNNGLKDFEVPVGDFEVGAIDFDGLEDIVYFNGSELNAEESAEILPEADSALAQLEESIDREITLMQAGKDVFHGSPFIFDEFKADRIGTGEGAQAFGSGLYFTDSQEIAEWYRAKNAEKAATVKKNGKELSDSEMLMEYFTPGQIIEGYSGFDKVVDFKESNGDWYVDVVRVEKDGSPVEGAKVRRHYTTPEREKVLRVLGKREGLELSRPKGAVYKAEIPKPETMLSWDDEISLANPYIQKALKGLLNDPESALKRSSTGKDIYISLSKKAGSAEEASKFLRSLGITGIQYRDSVSRGGGKGGFNYVVFDDSLIKVRQISLADQNPPIPNDTTVNELVGQFDPTGEDIVIVSRPVELMYRGRTREQMESFQKLLKRIRVATMNIKGITPEMADIATELQYNNLRYRSEVTGIPLEKLTAPLTFGKLKTDKGGAFGTANIKIGEDGLSKAIKVLFAPKADIATVVHELGHTWLQFMGDDTRVIQAIDPALLTDKQKEFLEVSKILSDKLGLQSLSELSDLSENDMRRIQETFAQTVESYFLRNEAAPGRMKVVMNKLALWMAGVAERVLRKIGPLGAYPTLKVDDKVRRVLDTILRNTAVAESEFDDVFQGAIYDDRILGARKEEYKKILAEAREEAISKIYNKASDKSFAEREKLIDKELNKIYDDAAAEVAQSTPIIFRDAIVNGPADQKITYESIQRVLANGDKAITDQLISGFNRKMIAGQKKAGVDVSVYMAQLGIPDPAQMVELLTQANNEQGLIDETANKMIDLLFPPMKTNEQIHEEAVKIVNSTLREKKVKLELKALADASPKKLAELAAIIAQPGANANKEMLLDESIDSLGNKALQFISAQQVKTFSASRVLSIANRYGRKAAKYLAKGDFDAAFEMKEQEAMYVLAYKKALEVDKAISQTVKRFNKYRNMSDRNAAQKGLNPELIAYINAIDTVMNVGMNGGFPEIEIATVRGGQYVEPTYEQFTNDRIKAVNASSSYGPNTEINVVNFLLIGEVVKATAKQARQSLETHKILEGQKITDFAESLAEEIGTRKEGDPTGEIGAMDSRKASDFIAGLSADLQAVANYFAALYPSEEAFARSQIGKLLARVREVEAEAQQNRDADWNILNERIKAIAKKDPTNRGLWKAIRRRLPLMRSQDLGKPIHAKDLNHTFSNKGEIIRLIALLGSESGRQAVIEGGLSQDESNIVPIGTYNPDTMLFESAALDAFIQECFDNGTITKEDMDLVQAIWDINEKHFPAVKKSVQNQFHFPIGYIQPTPIQTPWGQYRGGYVPLHRALTLKRSKELVAKFTPNGFTTLSSDLLPFFTPSMAKERTGSPLPVSLDLSRLRADLNAIYRAGYMQESMAIVAKVFNEPSFRKSMESRRPGLLDNVLIPWVERTLSQKYSSEIESNTFNSGARVLQALRRNQAIQAFIFNPATIAKQQLGIFPATTLVGQSRMYRSWFNAVRQRKKLIEAISKKSKFMERRFQTNQTRAIDSFEDFSLNYDQLSKMRDFTETLTYLPIQMSQNLVDAATFIAAEEYAKEKLKVSESVAVTYAETVVERSQGSTAVSSRPAILYWGGEYGRVLTAFGSQVLAMYGLNRSLRERIAVNNPDSRSKRLAELGFVIGMTVLIPAIGAFMLSNPAKTLALPFADEDDEEDKKDYLKDMALDMTKEMVDVSVPFIGNPLITLALEGRQKATGEIPMARTVEATARTIGRAGTGVLSIGEELAEYGETEVNLSENEVRDLLTTITTLTGDPISAAIRRALGEYSKIEDFIEEE